MFDTKMLSASWFEFIVMIYMIQKCYWHLDFSLSDSKQSETRITASALKQDTNT